MEHAQCRAEMEKEELDRQYTPSLWSRRLPPDKIVDYHIQYLSKATAHAQEVLRCEVGVCYDEESGEVVDIYYPTSSSKDSDPPAVLIYIHGGYWSALGVEHSGFLAEPCAARGIAVVAVGYSLAPKVSMTTIVHQCRLACAFVARRFPHSKLFVGGHSAGGHLTACMLYTDWNQYGMETQPFSGAILLSGIFNLVPIQKSIVSQPLHLTETEVTEYSPQKNLEQIKVNLPPHFPCLMAVGGDESDEFQRQGEEFHKGLVSVGVASSNSTLPGRDHFDLTERLTDTSYSLAQTILEFISGF